MEHYINQDENITVDEHIATALEYRNALPEFADVVENIIKEFMSDIPKLRKQNIIPVPNVEPLHSLLSKIKNKHAKSLLWTHIFDEFLYPPLNDIFQKDKIDFQDDFLNSLFYPLLPPEGIQKRDTNLYFTIFEYWDMLINPWPANVRDIDKYCSECDIQRIKSRQSSYLHEFLPTGTHIKDLVRQLLDIGLSRGVIRMVFDYELYNRKMPVSEMRVSDANNPGNPAMIFFEVFSQFILDTKSQKGHDVEKIFDKLSRLRDETIYKRNKNFKSVKLKKYLDDREKFLITARIKEMKNHTNIEIAKTLGICLSTFQEKCKKYGIKVRESKQ